MKTCTKCGLSKEIKEFHKDRQKKDGLCSICKICNYKPVAEWQKQNAKKSNENTKKWQSKNPDKVKEVSSKYQKNNKGKVNANGAKRYAAKLQRTPPWLTKEQFNEIKSFYIHASAASTGLDDEFEVDHIIPLQGENVSGLHVPWNLQILTKSENITKSNRI